MDPESRQCVWSLYNKMWKVHRQEQISLKDINRSRRCPGEWDRVIFLWSEVKSLSRVWLFTTPWIVVYQALPSMGFSRQECWSGLPLPSPGDLPNPGIELRSPALQADALRLSHQGTQIQMKGSSDRKHFSSKFQFIPTLYYYQKLYLWSTGIFF